MKAFIIVILILTSFQLLAQESILVNSKVIDIGKIRETLGDSTKKIILRVSENSPEDFKIKFKYEYRFVSQKLSNLYVAPSGVLSYSTQMSSSERYEGEQKILMDISKSSVSNGDVLDVLIEISKPNKNSHGIKVDVSLLDAKGNTVNGGRKLLGLLGRSYAIESASCK